VKDVKKLSKEELVKFIETSWDKLSEDSKSIFFVAVEVGALEVTTKGITKNFKRSLKGEAS
jgi:hypothetical protein